MKALSIALSIQLVFAQTNNARGMFAWVAGPLNVSNPVYASQGVASEDNVIGCTSGAGSAYDDMNRRFFVHGGSCRGSIDAFWLFHEDNATWTFLGGNKSVNDPAVYGTVGVFGDDVTPRGMHGHAMFYDKENDVVYSFFGRNLQANVVRNQIWKYKPGLNKWALVAGHTESNVALGNYGTIGVSSPAIIPGGRFFPQSWFEASTRQFYVHCGYGFSTTSTQGYLFDFWRYNMTTSEWTLLGGGSQMNVLGTFGTAGQFSSGMKGGARMQGGVAFDSVNRIAYIYGGFGYAATGATAGVLADLIAYKVTTDEWAYLGGFTTTISYTGNYGVIGVETSTNMITSGQGPTMAIDRPNNRLLVFGGNIRQSNTWRHSNHLWQYNLTSSQFTWIGGSSAALNRGNFTEKGVEDPNLAPSARYFHQSFFNENNGRFYISGGFGRDQNNADGYLSDTWYFRAIAPVDENVRTTTTSTTTTTTSTTTTTTTTSTTTTPLETTKITTAATSTTAPSSTTTTSTSRPTSSTTTPTISIATSADSSLNLSNPTVVAGIISGGCVLLAVIISVAVLTSRRTSSTLFSSAAATTTTTTTKV